MLTLLLVATGIQTARLSWAKKDLQTTKAQNESLVARIATQNQAVLQWKDEGEKAKRQAEQAQAAAARTKAESIRRIAQLRSEPVPADCIEATAWAAGKAKGLAGGWR